MEMLDWEWWYSGGDALMCQCKLVVTFMCLQFALMAISIIRDGMRC